MGGFLHFVETGLQSLTLDQCAKLGLGHAFTQEPTARKSQLTLGGPAVSGLLLYDTRDFGGADQGVNVAKQTWRYRGEFDGERVWTGYNNDDPPTSDSLATGRSLECFAWLDAQGRAWRVPWIGDVDDTGMHEAALPCEVDFDTNGRITKGGVVARYRALWDAAKPIWSELVSSDRLDPNASASFACQCLATLYRVSHVELGMLGVFSEEPIHCPEAIVGTAVGYFRWQKWKEAKETDPLPRSSETPVSDTDDGSEG